MVVCQHFLRGSCHFGAGCRNEHIQPGQARPSGFGNSSAFGSSVPQSVFCGTSTPAAFGSKPSNAPVSAFGSTSTSGGTSSFGPGAAKTSAFDNNSTGNPSHVSTSALAKVTAGQVTLSAANMREDLGPKNQPMWKISSYGPAKYEPNLWGGVDVSPEEMRLRAYDSLKEGRITDYAQQEATLASQVDGNVNQALSNIDAAYQQALENTAALTGSSTPSQPPQQQQQPQTNNAFQRAGTSAFGAPSTFGPTSTSAFGQTSAFGSTGTNTQTGASGGFGSFSGGSPNTASAFGATTTPARPAFGSPSSFGNNNSQTSAFGGTSAFGQSSTFGAPSTFGASTSTQPTSAFGQPSPFGATSQGPTPTAPQTSAPTGFSAFGKASTFGAAPSQTSNTFGGTSSFGTQGSGFGSAAAAPASNSTFGSTNIFGQAAATATQGGVSAFGAVAPIPSSAFGSLSFSTSTSQAPAAANQSSQLDAWADEAPKEEALPEEILALFKADQFEWGRIPGIEPPISVR